MKRFAWPLERLLDVTRHREDMLRAEMARLLAEIERLRNEAARRRSLLQRMLADLSAQPLEKRLPGQQTFLAFSTSVEREIATLEGQIAQLQATKARTNERLQTERMRRQTLERLRERAEERYRKDVARFEQKQTNEVARIAFVRAANDNVARASRP